MRRLARSAFKALLWAAILKGIAYAISRVFEGDDTASDDNFKLLAVMDGRQIESTATRMRTGSATTLMGGIDIDLTAAELDPGGAHVAVKAVFGGVRITVPGHWRVLVEQDARGGEIEVKTPDPTSVDPDGPRLTIEAYARFGGILIRPAE